MAEGSVPQQQQQYPNLNPYASSNGQSGQVGNGQSYGQQAENAKNSLYNSKVSAYPSTTAYLPVDGIGACRLVQLAGHHVDSLLFAHLQRTQYNTIPTTVC